MAENGTSEVELDAKTGRIKVRGYPITVATVMGRRFAMDRERNWERTAEAFQAFVDRHRHLAEVGIEVVAEDNEAMTGSYAMIDPAGRFFDNTSGGHRYGRPILDVGIIEAWQGVQFDLVRFIGRGGAYNWRG